MIAGFVFAALAISAVPAAEPNLKVLVYVTAPALLSGAEIIQAAGGSVAVVNLGNLERLEENLTRLAGAGRAGEGRLEQAIERLSGDDLQQLTQIAAQREEAISAGVDFSRLPAALFSQGNRTAVFYGSDLRHFFQQWKLRDVHSPR